MSVSAKIQLGDYIVIQRQKYTKLQKFGNLDATSMLGKDQIELKGLWDQPYSSTFKMVPKVTKSGKRGPRLHTLELCSATDLRSIREVLGISASGSDNRNIQDDGDSQALRSEDIEELRDKCNESTKIIEKIVENSKTFHEKTEYSQEKYLKKKEKKYFEYVQIRKPTIRLISEIYYRQDAEKIMGMRMDTLSQLISYADVSAFGSFLMYEGGSNGLLPATFLNSMGAGTEATLVHMHPGNVPQKQAILALNLPDEQLARCISVNIYSVLREYYQGDEAEDDTMSETITKEASVEEMDSVEQDDDDGEPCSKKTKLDVQSNSEPTAISVDESQNLNLVAKETANGDMESSSKNSNMDEQSNSSATIAEPIATASAIAESIANASAITESIATATATAEPQKWQLENRRACALMREKFDSLVIAAKEHPANIVEALLPLLRPSRPLVVFSQCKEVLMELYVDLKTNSNVTNLHLTSNWMRMYQILPNRTHPEVNMNGNSGYLLCGYTTSQ